MIENVEEGKTRYIAALRQYKELSEPFSSRRTLGHSEWYKLDVENARIRGMAEVLGITPEEDAALDHEVGIRHWEVHDENKGGGFSRLKSCCAVR